MEKKDIAITNCFAKDSGTSRARFKNESRKSGNIQLFLIRCLAPDSEPFDRHLPTRPNELEYG